MAKSKNVGPKTKTVTEKATPPKSKSDSPVNVPGDEAIDASSATEGTVDKVVDDMSASSDMSIDDDIAGDSASDDSEPAPSHEEDHEAEGGDMPEPGDDIDLQDEDIPSDDIDDASDKPHADDLLPEQPAVIEEKVVERIIERRGGFLPALIGGIVAAVLGFIAGRGDYLDAFFPRADSGLGEQIVSLQDDVKSITETVAGLDGRITDSVEGLSGVQSTIGTLDTTVNDGLAKIGGLETDLGGVKSGLDDAGSKLSGLQTTLSELDVRLTDIEKAPIDNSVSEAAVAAYERELAGLQDAIAEQQSTLEAQIAAQKDEVARLVEEAQALESSAVEAETAAKVQTGITDILTAIESGAPFADSVASLQGLGIDVPETLAGPADTGVATLASLQDGFAPLARSALATAREASEESQGIGSFLQRQLGARSVTPQDGDSADAILSRIEAALSAGDISTVLQEADALPEAAKEALETWTASAATRQAASDAANALADNASSN